MVHRLLHTPYGESKSPTSNSIQRTFDENTRQASAYDNDISCQLGNTMPTCRTGTTHSLTQLLHVRSQIDRHLAWGARHSRRVTLTTITLNGTTPRRHSNTSPSTNEQIPHQLLRSSATNTRTNCSFNTRWSSQLNLWVSTATISSYSLASTFPLYREISINSYDVGYFKLVHPTTVQVFIRLHKYAWR